MTTTSLLLLCLSLCTAFQIHQPIRYRYAWGKDRLRSYLEAIPTSADEHHEPCSSSSPSWMHHGLLISSFSDGVKANPEVQAILQKGLIRAMLLQEQSKAEQDVKDSVLHSPCAGPCISTLDAMQQVDDRLHCLDSEADSSSSNVDLLTLISQKELRFCYIPTAMYALRPDSENTPGKQRQRARTDGKSRRNEIVDLLQTILPDVNIVTVTLDLDDASIKQPQQTILESKSERALPKSGREALTTWEPHLVYIQGGNTFWLYHCVEKGGWKQVLSDRLATGKSFYCGSSAGAIVMGARVETACWKGWDDPRVVPGMETYEAWSGVPGLEMVGPYSFFPHMSEEWEPLVAEKQAQVANVICLTDKDVCVVQDQSISLVSCEAVKPTFVRDLHVNEVGVK